MSNVNTTHEMSFGDHLDELRSRVITSLLALVGVTIVCFIDQDFYMKIVLLPHLKTMQSLNLSQTIQVLRYEESFFCYLKVSLISALILTTPFILYQMWLFISAGLYQKEKKYLLSIFPFILIFFIIGVLFGYFILIPLGLSFLSTYGSDTIQVGFTLSSYISLFFILTFISGLIFIIPLLMLMLVKIKLLSSHYFLKNWRYSILIAFFLAAVLTPPDVVTQLLMAGPLIFLYFLGIALCRFSERMPEIKQFFNIEDPHIF